IGRSLHEPGSVVDPASQRPGEAPDPAQGTGNDRGADRADQPRAARMGALLQACSCPQALQPAQPMGRPADLVAPLQALEMLRLETASGDQAVRRTGAGQPDRSDPFPGISEECVSMKAGCGKTARPVWAA